MLIVPEQRRIWTPHQQQQAAPHAALLMTTGAPPDPYFGNVVNLTTFDGANGATTFPNLATTGAGPAFAVFSGTPALSNAYAEYASQATSLATTRDNMVDTGTNAIYNMPQGDFTLEMSMMVRDTGTAGNAVVWEFLHSGSGRVLWGYIPSKSSPNYRASAEVTSYASLGTGSNSVPLDAWHKHAVVRSGVLTYYFIDGVLQGSSANISGSGNASGTTAINLAARSPNAIASIYFANFRYTKGVGRYTANYTPATGPFPTS